MKEIQYSVFNYLFGIDYRLRRNKKKIIVVSHNGYQQSDFDEYCQTWIYLFLYLRRYKHLSISEWKSFMNQFECTFPTNTTTKENTSLGFTGRELSNPHCHKMELISLFQTWFLSLM